MSKIMLPCKINKIRYSSSDTFFVLSAELDGVSDHYPDDLSSFPAEWTEKEFTIQLSTDFEANIEVLRTYVFSGEVKDHERFGVQFKSTYFFPDIPTSTKLMRQYLDVMPNVGPVRARMMIDRFGEEGITDVIENTPEKLIEISGITEDRAVKIHESWIEDREMRDVYVWMCQYEIPIQYAQKIVKSMGKGDIVSRLNRNPYLLMHMGRVGFKTVDAIAHRVLDNVPANLRVLYGTKYVMGEARSEGHLCVPVRTLEKCVEKILSEFREQENFSDEFHSVISNNFVILKNGNKIFAYDPGVFSDERTIAYGFAEMVANDSLYDAGEDDIEYAENELSFYMGRDDIKLDPLQAEAVKSAFTEKVSVITGGGGTGKSTICRCIHTIAVRKGLETAFLTPTGAAAKVLSEKTSTAAMTIHRALGMTPGSGPSPDHDISANILVIDEFSMVGIDTLPHVMKAILSPSVTNVILVGDPQQLPSVSAGNFLSEVIESGLAKVIKLERIHRQSELSYIPVVADDIAKGNYAGIPADAEDVTLVEAADDYAAARTARNAVAEYMEAHGNLDGLQVLSPMYKGNSGVDNLCTEIQEMVISEGSEAMSHKNNRFYVGDRVMQMANNYQKDIYNGNIGHVVDFGARFVSPGDPQQRKFMTVDFDGREIEYIGDEVDEIRVCWCCTVHKYQGSQVENVILICARPQFRMMSRELVYTGMTRASKRLQIIGTESMIDKANSVSVIKKRYSNTADMMRVVHTGKAENFAVKNRHLAESTH